MTRIVAVAAVGVLALGAALAYAAGPGGRPSAAPGPPFSGGAATRHFIEMMIPHHEDAVAAAKLARNRAEHAEVRALAAEIERTQTAEIAQMRAWYRQWYGTSVPRRTMPGRGSDTAALAEAEPFDRAFLAQMIDHHAMGVHMVTMLEPRVDRPPVAALMREMAETQGREIEQMQAWYADWYGEAPPAARGPGMGRGMDMGMHMGRGMGMRMAPGRGMGMRTGPGRGGRAAGAPCPAAP
jgi:uncharacterized protein (DUF305 family)